MPAKWLATKELPLATLERFPGNARRGNVGEIRKSILRNGQYRSLVVRQHDGGELTILAGNHTADALTQLVANPPALEKLLDGVPERFRGEQEAAAQALLEQLWAGTARCEIVTCTDAEAIRINTADNRLSDIAVDDPESLVALLTQLDGDLDGSGWDADALKGLESLLEPPDLDDLADETGEPEDDDGWPAIRIRVPHHLVAAWNDHVKAYGDDDAAAFAQLLGLEVEP